MVLLRRNDRDRTRPFIAASEKISIRARAGIRFPRDPPSLDEDPFGKRVNFCINPSVARQAPALTFVNSEGMVVGFEGADEARGALRQSP